MPSRITRAVLRVDQLEARIVPDGTSAGALGTEANELWDLGLDGQGIYIGQVERGRSHAKTMNGANFDPSYHPHVQPAKVYSRDGAAVKGSETDEHATAVAGVMISLPPMDDQNKDRLFAG